MDDAAERGRHASVSVLGRGSSLVARALAVIVVGLFSLGCYNIPEGRYAVSKVTIDLEEHDKRGPDADDLAQKIATRETTRFLGFVYGFVYDYELFDRFTLARDLARVERAMRARGYYESHVREARVIEKGNKVEVTIEVEEGPPVLVTSVVIAGDEAVAADTRAELASAVQKALGRNKPIDEDKLAAARTAAVKALTSRGHAAAVVTPHAEVDLASHTAAVRFDVVPGPLATFGAITFKGLKQLDDASVRRVFGVEPGARYSSDEIDEARQSLLDLGVFASVDVAPDLTHVDDKKVVPLTVTCEEAKLRTVLFGGGFEFDSLKTDVHATVGWQNANFLGALRRFDIRDTPGVVLFPTRFPDLKPPDKLLFENRLIGTLRQPAFVERRTTGITRLEYNVYPVILPNQGTSVVGYHEVSGAVGFERWFKKLVFVSPQYALQTNFPINYLNETPDLFTLLISYVDVFAYLEGRNDPLNPHKGYYVGLEMQYAGGPLQGDATDFKIQPDVRGYLPISKRMTLVARASVGFLFPQNYGDAAEARYGKSTFDRDDTGRDDQILFFRGFFSGGPSSNRGYPLRGIGPRNPVPFVSPAGQSRAAAGCDPSKPCDLPIGGLSLWEANLELRVVVAGPFSTAFFCDSGDVSPYELDVRLDRPHLSCGTGARYDTKVGPIRLDIGFRIPGLQHPPNAVGELDQPLVFDAIPMALAFGIGEPF